MNGGGATVFAYGPDAGRVRKSSAFADTLYAGAEVEIDRKVPGSESFTRYPHPDLKLATTGNSALSESFTYSATGDTGPARACRQYPNLDLAWNTQLKLFVISSYLIRHGVTSEFSTKIVL